MPEIRPLVDSDFEAVYATFLAGTVPGLEAAHYRPMFVSSGAAPSEAGYGLFDGTRLVGVLGTLVSPRTIGGASHEVCNLHSWFVQPEYRGYSLALMRPVLRAKQRTLTDFSPSPGVCAISLKLGFQWLDGRLTLLFRPWRRRRDESLQLELVTDRSQIASRTQSTDPTVRTAIHDPTLTPVLAIDGDGECLVLARHVGGRRPHCYVSYLSDPIRFAQWSLAIRSTLLDLCGGSFVAVEHRRVAAHRLPVSFTLPASTPQLVRPAQMAIDASEIDTLRSELQFNGLGTLPGKRLLTSALAARVPGLGGVARRLAAGAEG